jgi:hypothetical protein
MSVRRLNSAADVAASLSEDISLLLSVAAAAVLATDVAAFDDDLFVVVVEVVDAFCLFVESELVLLLSDWFLSILLLLFEFDLVEELFVLNLLRNEVLLLLAPGELLDVVGTTVKVFEFVVAGFLREVDVVDEELLPMSVDVVAVAAAEEAAAAVDGLNLEL